MHGSAPDAFSTTVPKTAGDHETVIEGTFVADCLTSDDDAYCVRDAYYFSHRLGQAARTGRP